MNTQARPPAQRATPAQLSALAPLGTLSPERLRELAEVAVVERAARGAVWLDVRYPSEDRFDRLPGAVNVPLNEVRNSFPVLEPSREYIVYCQSGRRSSAAAFLFAQRGFKVSLLAGGLWAAGRGR